LGEKKGREKRTLKFPVAENPKEAILGVGADGEAAKKERVWVKHSGEHW